MKDEVNLSANTPLNLSKSTQKCKSDFLQGTLAIYETIAIDTGFWRHWVGVGSIALWVILDEFWPSFLRILATAHKRSESNPIVQFGTKSSQSPSYFLN